MSYDHEEIRRFSEHGSFSVLPGEIRDSNMAIVHMGTAARRHLAHAHRQGLGTIKSASRVPIVAG